MGVEYYLVNHANKTFFELGKGSWYELANVPRIVYEPVLFTVWFRDIGGFGDKEWKEFGQEYYRQIGLKLFELVSGTEPHRIVLINDCGDDTFYMRCLGYRCIGSRYYLDDEKENRKTIEFENRHLTDQEASRLYTRPNDKELYRLKTCGWN